MGRKHKKVSEKCLWVCAPEDPLPASYRGTRERCKYHHGSAPVANAFWTLNSSEKSIYTPLTFTVHRYALKTMGNNGPLGVIGFTRN